MSCCRAEGRQAFLPANLDDGLYRLYPDITIRILHVGSERLDGVAVPLGQVTDSGNPLLGSEPLFTLAYYQKAAKEAAGRQSQGNAHTWEDTRPSEQLQQLFCVG